MLVITDRLTIGQITFMLRVATQILSYGGLFLIVRILLTGTPRVASLRTHDIVRRVVSSSAFTLNSLRWILDSFRLKTDDLVRPPHLLFCVVLFTLYGPFVSLSDIGLLGFTSCSVPVRSSFWDRPASITTADQARSALAATLIGTVDLATINAHRCDSVEVVRTDSDLPFRNCTAWHNSTYADSTFFTGINMTDSAALVPLQLRKSMNATSTNIYYVGPEIRRVETATIRGGILVDPHETGFRAIFGVPALIREQKATLNKTMALEVDIGCMESGIYASYIMDIESYHELFATNSSWRKYSGPDYLRNVLSKAVDKFRQYSFPLFNKSTINQDGFMQSFGRGDPPGYADSVQTTLLDYVMEPSSSESDGYISGNCTDDLNQQLMLDPRDAFTRTFSCNSLVIGGLRFLEGSLYWSTSKMVCATTTQVNMVSATVQMDAQGDVTLNFTRLPSDLNYIKAGDWRVHSANDGPFFLTYNSVERYVLQDNPLSPTNHYIAQDQEYSDPIKGLGSGSTVFSNVGTSMIMAYTEAIEGLALNILGHNDTTPLNASTVTRWAGQVGASYILGSIAYNGWVALSSEPILVSSTRSTLAICYKPLYAIGFFPLVASAIVVIAWTTAMYLRKRLTGSQQLERLYDGMNPFAQVVCQEEKETLLIWRGPESHLEVISRSEAVEIGGRETVLDYLMSEPKSETLDDDN